MKRCDQCGEMMFYRYGGVYQHACPATHHVVGEQDIDNRKALDGDLTGLIALVYAHDAKEAAEKYVEERWVDLDYSKVNVCYVRKDEPGAPWYEVTVEAEQQVAFHGSVKDLGPPYE